MARRERLGSVGQEAPLSYFLDDDAKGVEFYSSGCELLDRVLGGGWAACRVNNIVGDRSSGKTLLGMEEFTNFFRRFEGSEGTYIEGEAAFDPGYAAAQGIPVERINSIDDIQTVEEFFDFVEGLVEKRVKKGVKNHHLILLDSLDSLSDKAEMERDIDEGTFGASKARQLSEIFRRITKSMSRAKVTLSVISQVRDNIGVTFGEKFSRSGGKALDFYCSQVLWLAEIRKVTREITRAGSKAVKPVGVDVRARCKKNKVGLPFRECEFPIVFGYGLDDLLAHAEYLKKYGNLADYDLKDSTYKTVLRNLRDRGGSDRDDLRALMARDVKRIWNELEKEFLPKSTKY